jgi:hypothetical protein
MAGAGDGHFAATLAARQDERILQETPFPFVENR